MFRSVFWLRVFLVVTTMAPKGQTPALKLRVRSVRGVRDGWYELRSCTPWSFGDNKYNYNLFRPGLVRPAISWQKAGARGYARAKLAGGTMVYLHRLAAFCHHRTQHPTTNLQFSAGCEAHHDDEDTTNNWYQNLRWWTKEQHVLFHAIGL